MVYVDTMLYDQQFQKIASWLARGDKFLAEELRSEMHIATARMEPGKPTAFYLKVAKYRAIDYLRSKAIHYSWGGAIKHVSLQAIRKAGYQIDTERNVYQPKLDSTVYFENIYSEWDDS